MCRIEQVFLAVSLVSLCQTEGAGACGAQRALASGCVSPFSPPCVIPGNEVLLVGDVGLGDIKSGLRALGAGAQT